MNVEGAWEAIGRVLQAKMSQDRPGKSQYQNSSRITERIEAPRMRLGGSWGRLEGSWGRLGGVFGGLGRVMEDKKSQDSAKKGQDRTKREIPQELPSGLRPPCRGRWVPTCTVPRRRWQPEAQPKSFFWKDLYDGLTPCFEHALDSPRWSGGLKRPRCRRNV